MRLAIVGSTLLAGNAEAQRIIDDAFDRLKPSVLVSGGADGIDDMSDQAAIRRGVAREIYKPTRRQWHGPGGFKERNQKIADRCEYLIRIISSRTTTYGSGWTRDRAAEQGKPTEEYIIKED